MLYHDSVSQWIAGLKRGELDAVQRVWDRYQSALIRFAQRRLENAPKGPADEEDIAQSVFFTLCRGAAAGHFEDVRSRDELWWLLLAITKRKSVDLIRRENAKKRGAGGVLKENPGGRDGSPGLYLDDLIGEAPTPDDLVMMDEQQRRLMNMLPDERLRNVAVSRIEGYTVAEIATSLSVSTRSVERKLSMIRKIWAADLLSKNA